MELQFCDSKKCVLCGEMRKKSYLRSKQSVEDRLAKIVARYANTAPKPRTEGDSDREYQTYVDNELSGGLV